MTVTEIHAVPDIALSGMVADVVQCSAMARKRRRLLLRSQRAASSSEQTATQPATKGKRTKVQNKENTQDESTESKTTTGRRIVIQTPRKVSDACTKSPGEIVSGTEVQSKHGKKPQMRYDPDVPMSKEETALWRREQRRKRNRESAAASRQRQRDRILELEDEVDEWKDKFNDAMERLQHLEQLLLRPQAPQGLPPSTIQPPVSQNSARPESTKSYTVSPTSSPPLSPTHTPALPTRIISGNIPEGIPNIMSTDGQSNKHLNETISRPAVKITGALTSNVPTTDMIVPDSCVSNVTTSVNMCPAPVSPSYPATAGAQGKAAEGVEDNELGEFLRDAVCWL